MRFIIYSGKDGVGKTSVASLTSVYLSSLGLSTLLISTDENQSLSNMFDITIKHKPTQVKEKLWALDIDSHNENWDIFHNWLRRAIKWEKLKGVSTDEIPIIPGIKQLLYLLAIKKYISSNLYDVIIVDCELLGEVLRLLSYPELLQWWMKKLFKNDRYLLKVVRPITKIVSFGFEIPNDQVMNSSEYLMEEVMELQKIMLNQEITSIRFVLTPDKKAIAQTRRIITYFNMLGFNVDNIIINKILPDELETGFFSNWYETQFAYIKEIETSFNPLPIFKIRLMDREVQGISQLEGIAKVVYKNLDLSSVLFEGSLQEIYKENGKYILVIHMPLLDFGKLQLSREGEELKIQVDAFERLVLLPKILISRSIEHSFYNNNQLYIQFEQKNASNHL